MYGANTGRVAAPSGKGFIPYDADTGYPVGPLEVIAPLVASDAPGQVFNWTNNFPFTVVVDQVNFLIETVSTGACTLQAGVVANAQTAGNGLITSADPTILGLKGPAAAVFLATTTTIRTVAPGQAVTISMQTGATAGLTGWAILKLTPLGIVRNS